MKRILISIVVMSLLSLAAISHSGDIPDGFIGLKWGHSLEKMKEEQLLYSVKAIDKNPDRVIALINLKKFNPFPDLKIGTIGLNFYKDKLYGGIVYVTAYKDWNLLSKTLKEKYGDPSIEDMKNVYGKSIGTTLKWDFGTGVGRVASSFNQLKNEGKIHYFFPPKELMDELSSQEEKDQSKVKDKL